MMELVLLVTLGALPKPVLAAGPFRPCVWPNWCAPAVAVLPVTTCQWPNRCRAEAEAAL